MTTTAIELYCDRCGRPFKDIHISDLCAPCAYATRPHTVTLGHPTRRHRM